jgi:hypothetical protein
MVEVTWKRDNINHPKRPNQVLGSWAVIEGIVLMAEGGELLKLRAWATVSATSPAI